MTDDQRTSGIPLIRKYGEELSELAAEWWDFIMSYDFCEQE